MRDALKVTGFITFLAVSFLNAFVDLGHKIIIQSTIFKVYDGSEMIVLTTIVNGLILLPFILMFTPTGYVSDKYPKNKVIRASAWVAFALTLLITIAYYQGWFWFSFGMTFLLALQSAFYSPAKYGFMKGLVGVKKLCQANGLLQAATTIGILLGTFVFCLLFENLIVGFQITDKDSLISLIAPLGWVLVGLTSVELFLAYRLPETDEGNPEMSFNWDDYVRGKTQARNRRLVKKHPYIWLSILGLSVFWAISQVLLATYPAYAKEFLHLNNTAVIQGMMAFAGIGVMIGSVISGRVSRERIETSLVPVGAVGLTLSLVLIRFFDALYIQASIFLLLGIMGGFIVVPLNALIQYHAHKDHLGRVLATSNLIQFSVMLLFLVITSAFAYYKFSSNGILWGLVVIAFLGTIYTIIKTPSPKSRRQIRSQRALQAETE